MNYIEHIPTDTTKNGNGIMPPVGGSAEVARKFYFLIKKGNAS